MFRQPWCRLPSSYQIAPTSRILPQQQLSMQTSQWRRWTASCPSCTVAGLQATQPCLRSSCSIRNSPLGPISHCPHICIDPGGALHDHGDKRRSVNLALVTPCHKRGRKNDPNNFRPIAVTHPLMRLYAGLLNTRLMECTEEASRPPGLRATSQAGFRLGHSVIHQMVSLAVLGFSSIW